MKRPGASLCLRLLAVLSVALRASCQALSVALHNLLPNDILVVDPQSHIPDIGASSLFFPADLSDESQIIYPDQRDPSEMYYSTGEYYDFVQVVSFGDRLGEAGEYRANALALTEDHKLVSFAIEGVIDSKLGSTLAFVADLKPSVCLRVSGFTFWLNNKIVHAGYCQTRDKVQFVDGSTAKDAQAGVKASGYLLKADTPLRMKRSFVVVPLAKGSSGRDWIAFNYLAWDSEQAVDRSKLQNNTDVLTVHLNDRGELEENVFNLNRMLGAQTNFYLGGLDYFAIQPVALDNDGGDELKLMHFAGHLYADPNMFLVHECIFNAKTFSLFACGLVVKSTEPSNPIVNISVVSVSRLDKQFEYRINIEILTYKGGVLSTEKYTYDRSVDWKEERGMIGQVAPPKVSESGLSQAAGVKGLRALQTSSQVREYRTVDAEGQPKVRFYEVLLSSGISHIYHTSDSSFVVASATGNFVELEKDGIYRFRRPEQVRLVVNTTRLQARTNLTLDVPFYTLDALAPEKQRTLHFTITFLSQDFHIPAPKRVCAVAKGHKSRLRIDYLEISGPLYDSRYDNESSTLFASSANRVKYFLQSNTSASGLEPVDIFKQKLTGTMDLLFDYGNAKVYSCRRFSQSFAKGTVNVFCRLSHDFSAKVEKLQYHQIINFQTHFGKILLLYTQNNTSVESPELVDICYLMLDSEKYSIDGKCFANIENAVVKHQVILGPDFAYFVYLVSADRGPLLQGYYIDWATNTSKLLEQLKDDYEVLDVSGNLVNSTLVQGLKTQAVLAVTGRTKYYSLLLAGGSVVRKTEILSPKYSIANPIHYCQMERNAVFDSFEDVYSLNASQTLFSIYNKEKVTDKKAKFFNLYCVNNHMTLVFRPQAKKLTLIRDSDDPLSERVRRQVSFDFPTIDHIHYNFFSRGEFYLMTRQLKSYHFSLEPDFTFVQTVVPRSNLNITISDIYDPANNRTLSIELEAVDIQDRDQASNASVGERWKKNKDGTFNFDLDFEQVVQESHLWRVDAPEGLDSKYVKSQNRFELVNATRPANFSQRCRAFYSRFGFEVCYSDSTLFVANELTQKLIFKAEFKVGFCEDILGMAKNTRGENVYTLITRQDFGSNHTIYLVDLWIESENGKLLSVQEAGLPSLYYDRQDIQVVWENNKLIAGWVNSENSDSLEVNMPSCPQSKFEKHKFVDFYDLFKGLPNSQGYSDPTILLFSTFNSDEISGYYIFTSGCRMEPLEIKGMSQYPMRYFNDVECRFLGERNTLVQCLFVGLKIVLVEFEALGPVLTVKSAQQYHAYKNMESQDVILGDGFFLLRASRFHDDEGLVHDDSGILYYKLLDKGGNGFMSGGLTNTDLLYIGSKKRFTMILTSNSTLVVSGGESPVTFRIAGQSASIQFRNLPEDLLNKGVQVALLGNQKSQFTLKEKTQPKSSSRLYLTVGVILLILVATAFMLYYLLVLRKRETAFNSKNNETTANYTLAAAEDTTEKTIM